MTKPCQCRYADVALSAQIVDSHLRVDNGGAPKSIPDEAPGPGPSSEAAPPLPPNGAQVTNFGFGGPILRSLACPKYKLGCSQLPYVQIHVSPRLWAWIIGWVAIVVFWRCSPLPFRLPPHLLITTLGFRASLLSSMDEVLICISFPLCMDTCLMAVHQCI